MTNAATTRNRPPSTTRRRFLDGLAGAATAAAAGCLGAVEGPRTLAWTGETVDLEGREYHHTFGNDAVVTVRQAGVARPDSPIPLSVILHHRRGLETESVRLRLRAPPQDGSAFDAAIHLASPPTDRWPALSLRRDADGWTVVEGSGLHRNPEGRGSGPGVANLDLSFLVVPSGAHPVADLFLDVTATLRETGTLGRRYRLSRPMRVPLVFA